MASGIDGMAELTENISENISLSPIGNGYSIYVSNQHTFGTDAVLLSHFAAPRRRDRAIDLGTGCGIIPLLWLRDNLVERAAGLELSAEAVALAEASGQRCGWRERLEWTLGDIRDPFDRLERGGYSLVTCNPPYKAVGAGLQSSEISARQARHEVTCTLEDVIRTAAGLLQYGGRLALCHRPERIGEIFSLMTYHRVEPKRLRLVCKTEGCSPWLVLVEGRLGGGKGVRIAPNLNVYGRDGELSPEMRGIYGPYLTAGRETDDAELAPADRVWHRYKI